MKKILLVLLFSLISITSYSSEGDLYDFSWLDPDKEVFVLQNRRYRKSGKVYFNFGAGITTSGAFVDATNLQGRVGFFFKEEIGFEAIYSLNSGDENETASSVRNEGAAGSRPFRRIVDSYLGAMVVWSPFYSKMNTFNQIIYIDWILGLGFAKLEETNNTEEFLSGVDTTNLKTESHTGLIWNTGALFYISEMFGLRFDLTTIHYKAEPASLTPVEKEWFSNWDIALSLAMRF